MGKKIYRCPTLTNAVSGPISLVPITTDKLDIAIQVVNIVADDLVQHKAIAKANIATVPIAIKNGAISK